MYRDLLLILLLTLSFLNLKAQIIFNENAVDLGINKGYGSGFFGGGISFYDFNNDGWDDITMATSWGDSIYFYQNNQGVFQQIKPSLVTNTSEVNQILWVDYDNDGDNDLFVTSHNDLDKLYRNDGNLNMNDVTAAAGLSEIIEQSEGAAWGDYNNDGLPDLYISIYNDVTVSHANALYHNNGNGTFTNIAETANVADIGKYPFQPLFTDFNSDGNQDIYIAMDRQDSNTVLENMGDGFFMDITQYCGGGLSMWAMCITPGDFDNDGDDDYYFSNLPNHGSKLVANLGNSFFEEIAEFANVDWQGLGWGSVFLDADLDGDLDLFQSGGHTGQNETKSSVFYENSGDGTFFESAYESFEFDTVQSFSNATGDINNDGFPDIVVSNGAGFNVSLWKNTSPTTNNYLKVKPVGVLSNRNGIGSRIYTFIDGVSQYRYIYYGTGYLAQNKGYALFGLGQAELVDSVVIDWLSGKHDVLYNVEVNRMITVVEGDGIVGIPNKLKTQIRIFPNPASNHLSIFNNGKTIRLINIDILYLNGIIIKSFDAHDLPKTLKLNISEIPSGVYLLRCVTNQGVFTEKLSIVR